MLKKIIFILCALILFSVSTAGADEEQQLPVKDTVTLIELGADNCLPCRLLTPIIEELQQEYQGRAAIVRIDVYRQHELARQFHPMVTPTMIFFDRQGQETKRFSGFMDKDSIVKELDRLLAGK